MSCALYRWGVAWLRPCNMSCWQSRDVTCFFADCHAILQPILLAFCTGYPEPHLLWPCQGHIMTLKDLHLCGGRSLTLFRLEADQTWSWSDLSLFFSRRQNSFINPKLQDILACIGYYLRLIFMWVELLADPENRNKHLHFFRVQAEGGHWRNCLQRLYRHTVMIWEVSEIMASVVSVFLLDWN